MAAPYQWSDELVDRGWLRVLTPSALKVLCVLSRHMSGRSSEAWPSAELVCERTGLSRSSIYGALAELKDYKLITSEIRAKQGQGRRQYQIEVFKLMPVPHGPGSRTRSSQSDSRIGRGNGETLGPARVSALPTGQFKNKDMELASSTITSRTGQPEHITSILHRMQGSRR